MIRLRVFFALSLAVGGVLIGAWTFAGGGVLKPLENQLIEERAKLLSTLSTEVENAEFPRVWTRRFSQNSDVKLHLKKKLPMVSRTAKRRVKIEESNKEVLVMKGRHMPMAIKMDLKKGPRWLVATFPVDLNSTRRRIGLGLSLIAIFASLAAWGLSRWTIRPLETAGEAMNRIASGDLKHRLSVDIGPSGKAFNQMAERLESMVHGQKQFIAAISHELRTPLTRIGLQLTLLEEETATSRIHSMRQDLQELDDLVASLLASAKIEQGATPIQIEKHLFADICDNAFRKLNWGERQLTQDFAPDQTLLCDETLTISAIRNLGSNFIRYTPDGSCATIEVNVIDNVTIIRFWDNGPGAPPELISTIFDPFVRAEDSRSKVTGGLGLGLMLIRQVAEAHNGSAKALNRENGGLEIQMRFSTDSSLKDRA